MSSLEGTPLETNNLLVRRYFHPLHSAVVLGLIALLLPPGWLSARSWEWGIRWLYILILSFLISSLLTPVSIYLAFRLGVLDIPDYRKTHRMPVPRLGGLAVFSALLLTVGRNFQFSTEISGLMIAASLIFVTGFIDDARGLSARVRLIVQVLASLILVGFGVRITFIPAIPGEAILETLITVVWMVGLTNAFNFLDGIDGLAAGMGAVCALLFLSIAWPLRQGYVSYFTVALAGGCLGFLPFNWRPARIYLGDGGSTFIGFTLAGLAIMGSWANNNFLVALSTPLLILSIPIFDMIYTTVSRVHGGKVHNVREWLEYVGRDHFHHRLMNLGMNEKQTVGFILMVNLCLGLASLTVRYTANLLGAALLLSQAFLIFIIITSLMILGRRTPPAT
ncbi:MAG: undecaprenyl/decaprenyl-phosphate alpha-N-acetylglucosaminyl 1-phosphate transferase [Elusimicrobia bacterium]|nr:undecaprenyl/decaprenyl-phosphate alpha-N-acetylglucosaminyl 1-phosphate transferase [Elusimicrobiota bacterium]